MSTYTGTLPGLLPPIGSPATGYVAVDESGTDLLAYPLAYAGLGNNPSNPATNYRLAFSTTPPTPRPSIGQIWPRGAGQA